MGSKYPKTWWNLTNFKLTAPFHFPQYLSIFGLSEVVLPPGGESEGEEKTSFLQDEEPFLTNN